MNRYLLSGMLVLCMSAMVLADDDDDRHLTVMGEAIVSVAPDAATLQVGVVAQANDAKTAQDQISEKMHKIIDAVTGLGISAADIQTSQLSLSPVYEDTRNKPDAEPRIIAYRAANTIQITTSDVAVGNVIDTAITAGANQINSLQFILKNDKNARRQALEQAAQDAMQKASTLAAAMNVRLGQPYQISESSVSNRPPQPMLYTARALSADTPVQSGQVEVRASIVVRYFLPKR